MTPEFSEVTVTSMHKPSVNSVSLNLKNFIRDQSSECYVYRTHVVNKLRSFVERLGFCEKSILVLHGSFSTGIVTPFSDIDLLLVIRDLRYHPGALEDLKKVRKLELFLSRLDPLMHHGVDIIYESDFLAYDESRLPVDSIDKSTLISGSSFLSISPDSKKSCQNARLRLRTQCESILRYSNSAISRTPYKLKCLVSTLFLVPVLLLQADRSIFLYKRESLALARDLYDSSIDFEVIDIASKLRDDWRVSRTVSLVRNAIVPFESLLPSAVTAARIAGLFFPRQIYDLVVRSHRFVLDVLNFSKKNGIV